MVYSEPPKYGRKVIYGGIPWLMYNKRREETNILFVTEKSLASTGHI